MNPNEIINEMDSLTEDEKEILYSIFDDFVFEIQKESFIPKISDSDMKSISQAILFLFNVPYEELEEAKNLKEYEALYNKLCKSVKDKSIDESIFDLYECHKSRVLRRLKIKRGRVSKEILGRQHQNYQRIKRADSEKASVILENSIKAASEKLSHRLSDVQSAIRQIESSFMMKLDINTIGAKVENHDVISYATFLILRPEHQLGNFLQLDESWEEFPLKWVTHHLPLAEGKSLLYQCNNGEDPSCYFEEKYKQLGFSGFEELLNSPYLRLPKSRLLGRRHDIIREIIECHNNEEYYASCCLSLTVIEGMLWDYANYLDSQGENIFSVKGGKSMMHTADGVAVDKPSIGMLLKHSNFNKFIDKEFIGYFCSELYDERNPIMHGEILDYGNIKNSCKKLATIEYLLKIIKDKIKSVFIDSLKQNIPREEKDKILDRVGLHRAYNKAH